VNELVLLVEDEEALVKGLSLSLKQAGYRVNAASDGPTGLSMAREQAPDLVILDVMLPGMDGFEVCRQIRQQSSVPIIMLTARTDDVDVIVGLELGADDYVVKPFNTRELIARMRAILRRVAREKEDRRDTIRAGDLEISIPRRLVTLAGKPVPLTPKEFDILAHLASHPEQVFSREQILQAVWGYDFYGGQRAVDVHVRRIREKIEPDQSRPAYLHTSWGKGYYFCYRPATQDGTQDGRQDGTQGEPGPVGGRGP
jgi:two-component system response regulator VicR